MRASTRPRASSNARRSVPAPRVRRPNERKPISLRPNVPLPRRSGAPRNLEADSLLATCCSLLATCCSLLATCYLLLATCYLLLATCYLLLATGCLLLAARYLWLGSRHWRSTVT